jgi:DNA mismatch endonuclease (patch repair protein)
VKDRLSRQRRSWNMSRIRGKDTTPEKIVRSLLHRMGYRFRLHVRIPVPFSAIPKSALRNPHWKVPPSTLNNQPSTIFVRPDIILPKYKTAIFVHGCFWHRHKDCKNCTTPTNRREWWLVKLNGNAARDKVHQAALKKLGWCVIVIWECELEKLDSFDRLAPRLP